jgi:hypothetical protein
MATFREITAAYVAERQALGFKVEKAEGAMRRICALHDEMGCRQDALPRGMVEAWCEIRPGEAESNRMLRVSWMRGLAEFMVRTGFDAYVPPRGRDVAGRAHTSRAYSRIMSLRPCSRQLTESRARTWPASGHRRRSCCGYSTQPE